MRTIYKYPIKITESQQIEIPVDAEIIESSVEDREGNPCVWAAVENLNETKSVKVLLVVTGSPIPEGAGTHVGCFNHDGLVWQVFVG